RLPPIQPVQPVLPLQPTQYETPSRTPEAGTRHRTSHRDAPEPGDVAASLRTPHDDGAAGERAAAVRRADHHHREAGRGRWREERPRAECAAAGDARSAGPGRRHQTVRYD